MSLSDPDALECRLCGEEFTGPDRREQYRAHRAEQHPAGEAPLAAVREVSPVFEKYVPPSTFACTCGRTFGTSGGLGGHIGGSKTHHRGEQHAPVGAPPKVSGQAVGKTAVSGGGTTPGATSTAAAKGSTPGRTLDPSPASDGEPERPAPDVPATLTGGTLTFIVSIDLAHLPESLDAVVAAIRAAVGGLGR